MGWHAFPDEIGISMWLYRDGSGWLSRSFPNDILNLQRVGREPCRCPTACCGFIPKNTSISHFFSKPPISREAILPPRGNAPAFGGERRSLKARLVMNKDSQSTLRTVTQSGAVNLAELNQKRSPAYRGTPLENLKANLNYLDGDCLM